MSTDNEVNPFNGFKINKLNELSDESFRIRSLHRVNPFGSTPINSVVN